jgi:hypothetical protein
MTGTEDSRKHPLSFVALVPRTSYLRVIVNLNVIHIDAVCHTRHLIQLTAVVYDVRIVCDSLHVALEVYDINFVEPDESHEKTYVSLGEGTSNQIAAGAE